jgi:hypothetical protein
MWLLQLIPSSWLEFMAVAILVAGVILFFAGKILKHVPFFRKYNLPMRVIGFILLLLGAYFNGGLGVELEYRERIAEMEQRIAVAEAKSQEENVKIVETIVTETKIVKEDTAETTYLIEQMKEQIDKQGCEISPQVIELYNEGITGRGK